MKSNKTFSFSKKTRNIMAVLMVLTAFVFSLGFRTGANQFIPHEAYHNLLEFFRITFLDIFDSTFVKEKYIDTVPYYEETIMRFKYSFMALVAGAAICLAGALFQTAFKNPIASPNILGASTGVTIGNMLFVITFGAEAFNHFYTRYVYCYGFALLVVGITLLFGKFSQGKKREFSVEATIIAGMMISHLAGILTQYFQIILQADETGLVEIYTTLTSGDYIFVDNTSFYIFIALMGIAIIPVYLIRYRYNMVAFHDDDAKSVGVKNSRLRFVGLALGSLMASVAMVHVGDVGMLSMMVPFMMRQKGQTEFGEVAFLSCCVGSTITLVSRIALEIIASYGLMLPSSVVLTAILMPIFVIFLIRREDAFG